jgi:UrcA family protein
MNKLSVVAAISVALSSIAAAPAAAQEFQVGIPYGDLDLASPAGAEALSNRIEAGIDSACERPDIRNLRLMAEWQACKDAALNTAAEQVARLGASVTVIAAN